MVSLFEIILYADYLAYDKAWPCPGYLYFGFLYALDHLLVFAILLAVPTQKSRTKGMLDTRESMDRRLGLCIFLSNTIDDGPLWPCEATSTPLSLFKASFCQVQ